MAPGSSPKQPEELVRPHGFARLEIPVPGAELRDFDGHGEARMRYFQLVGALADPELEVRIELFKLLGLAEQLDEDPHLGAQQFRNDGDRYIVDGAKLIAPQAIHVGHLDGGDEDDSRLAEARVIADDLGKLKTVEIRHDDIDQNDRDLMLEELLQGLVRGAGPDDLFVQLLQDRFDAQQLRGLIVDKKYLYTFRHSIDHQGFSGAATCATPTAIARC